MTHRERSPAPGISDLRDRPFVRNEICARIEQAEFRELLSTTQISAQNTLSLISMIRSGHWITVLPSSVVHIDPERVAFRKIRGLSESRQVDLFFSETGPTRGIVRDLVEVLMDTDCRQIRPGAVDYSGR